MTAAEQTAKDEAASAMLGALKGWDGVINEWRISGKLPDYRALMAAQDIGNAAMAQAEAAGIRTES